MADEFTCDLSSFRFFLAFFPFVFSLTTSSTNNKRAITVIICIVVTDLIIVVCQHNQHDNHSHCFIIISSSSGSSIITPINVYHKQLGLDRYRADAQYPILSATAKPIPIPIPIPGCTIFCTENAILCGV